MQGIIPRGVKTNVNWSTRILGNAIEFASSLIRLARNKDMQKVDVIRNVVRKNVRHYLWVLRDRTYSAWGSNRFSTVVVYGTPLQLPSAD